jgi:hypothetical protein
VPLLLLLLLLLQVWRYPKVEDLYVDDNVYVWSRGPFVIVMTNVGEAGPTTVTNNTVITIPGLPRRFHSSRLRNIYDKQVKATSSLRPLTFTA